MEHERRLQKLNERLAKIQAEMARIKAQASEQARKEDTRKKIVVGGMIFALVRGGELSEEWLRERLDKMLTNPNDRKLFDLPPMGDNVRQMG